VSATPSREPIVIDTDVFSAQLVKGSALSERYAPLVAGRKAFVSFQTAAEVRYGALVRDWGRRRLRELDAKLTNVEIVHSGPELVGVHAQLRADCHAAGQCPPPAGSQRGPLDRRDRDQARDPTRVERPDLQGCAWPEARDARDD